MNKYKNNLLKAALTVIVVVVISGIYYTSKINLTGINKTDEKTIVKEQNITPSITPVVILQNVNIKFKDGRNIAGKVFAQTAYEALSKIAKEKGIQVEVKQYKLGVMVTKIGDNIGSNQYFWSYKVNGKMGTMAADRYILKPGDSVEWEYVKITQ